MEEISEIFENVSIRDWADQIREIKTRELGEIIKNKEQEVNVLKLRAKMGRIDTAESAFELRNETIHLVLLKLRMSKLKRTNVVG